MKSRKNRRPKAGVKPAEGRSNYPKKGRASRAFAVQTGLRIKELLGNDPNPRGVFGVPPKEPNQKTANEVMYIWRRAPRCVCVCVCVFVCVY